MKNPYYFWLRRFRKNYPGEYLENGESLRLWVLDDDEKKNTAQK
jgi:hypothetical protein